MAVPDWYRANPGRAAELALVFVTGDAERIGLTRVTNRRWATSAYGTASSCALTARDTVYCCSPTHHATGMLVCVGGALVSGARLAMATRFTPSIDPKLFWEDVRRYGVNVVFYTGSSCRALVNSPESPDERHHPLRLFAGSGMPPGIWRRVLDRFSPARVVEFFASSEGNAVLVNLTGEKIGSLGTPLPGAADLAVAAWDLEKGQLVEDTSGFARPCPPGGIGLLIARVDARRGEVEGRPLRGVFEAGDAWLDTRDLVRCDADGDYWLIDDVRDVIRGARGALPTIPVERRLVSEVDFVDLAAVYGVRVPGASAEVPVAAVTLRRNARFDPVALRAAIEANLSPAQRPLLVRVLDELPLTAGHRTRKRQLRAEGLGLSSHSGESFWLAPGRDGYEPFEAVDQDALIASLRVR